MSKMSGLPALKVGQVWQCRDQSKTGNIISGPITHQYGTHEAFMSSELSRWFYTADRGGVGFYQGELNPGGPSGHDLVHLIYDSDETT